MPYPLGVPKVNITNIPTHELDGPYGAKEASNGSITLSPPAVVSAIHDATGVWIKELLATPEKIWRALKEKKKEKAGF